MILLTSLPSYTDDAQKNPELEMRVLREARELGWKISHAINKLSNIFTAPMKMVSFSCKLGEWTNARTRPLRT